MELTWYMKEGYRLCSSLFSAAAARGTLPMTFTSISPRRPSSSSMERECHGDKCLCPCGPVETAPVLDGAPFPFFHILLQSLSYTNQPEALQSYSQCVCNTQPRLVPFNCAYKHFHVLT